ncbi:MAG TPA: glycosyltransferase, partial [Flavisolibacter sp.]|nr:glycosyltransferase [Flavisolibacter sp.]
MSSKTNNLLSSLKPGTRILFANFPADGHFNPLTGLAVHLKNSGCDVRWYTSPRYEAKIDKLGIPFYSFQRAVDFFAEPSGIDSPERAKCKTAVSKLNFDLINAFILRGAEFYEDVKDIYKEFPFDIVIGDICFTGIPFIREKMGLPVIAIGILPLSNTSKDLPPSGLGITPSDSFFGRLKQAFLRTLAKKVLFAKSDKVMHREFERYGIDVGNEFVFDVLYTKSSLVLQSGCPSFEYKRSDLNRKIKFIGALLPYGNRTTKERWFDERLTQYKKVVVVTQGTVETDVNKLLVPTLEALKNSDVLVIATTGGSGTEELRQRFPENNLIIEDFIPFADVMPHAQAYITNGGYGGVMLGIQHGLPLVVAGVHEGKNEINARIGYFGYGINLKTETPKPVQIRCAVEEILKNQTYKKNV